MTLFPSPNDSPQEKPLVEPEPAEPRAADTAALDTEEILRRTQSISTPQASSEHTAQDSSSATEEQANDGAEGEQATPRRLNVLAVMSLILALTASPLSVVFGYLAVGQIRRANQRGESMAWVAVGLGWLWLIAWIVAGVSVAVIWIDI
jgi:uncharacterized membrane protein YcjF (UPF0283 family)